MGRDIQPIIDLIHGRLAETLADYSTWYPRLVDFAKRGYPSGGDGAGRSSEVPDPTFRAAVSLDEVQAERVKHDNDMKQLLSIVKRLERRRSWVLLEHRKDFNPLPVVCETCGEYISQVGNDKPREGECQRCYKHRQRNGGLPYPLKRVVGRSVG